MSFPKYPEYKDSGVEWLGEVPAHWEVKRLRYVAELNPSKSEVRSLPAESSVSFIPMEAVGEDGSLSLDQTRPIGEVLAGYTYVREGDVTIAKITPCFENGKGAVMRGLNNDIGFGTTELTVIRPIDGMTMSDYLYRVVSSEPFRVLGESSMYGAGGQKRVPDDFVRNFTIAWPPFQEQAEIHAFLDHETARIDALVEEQQRLIELLKEKRQAVISHAVTKGLDPGVPMKDSGVEWLGEVPAHWEVCKLGHVCRLQGGYAFNSSGFSQDGVTIVRMNNLKRGRLDLESSVKVSPDDCDSRFQLAEGDILYGMSGSIGDTGSLGNYAIVSRDDLPAQLNQRVGRFLLERGLLNSYLELVIQSSSFYEQVLDQVTGTAQFNVSSDQVESCKITFPKIEEQAVIARDVRARLEKMDKLMDLAADQIHYLQERRSALISAAVTGKIDVRSWQPPAGSSAPAEISQTETV